MLPPFNPKHDPGELKRRIANTLLPELKAGKLEWYYISVADDEFQGAYLIRACGPTDAWRLLHVLGWWERGSTETHGPIPEDKMLKIPEEKRWRKLSREEAMNLGKE